MIPNQSKRPPIYQSGYQTPFLPNPKLENPHSSPPPFTPRINENLIGKGIDLRRRNGRDVIPIPIHNIHNLQHSPLYTTLHRPPGFYDLGIGPRSGERHVQNPGLPDQFVVRSGGAEPPLGAGAFLLHEVHDHLASPALGFGGPARDARGGTLELSREGGGAGVDQGLEFDVGDEGEGHVEEFVGGGFEGGEVAVEEDRVENGWGRG